MNYRFKLSLLVLLACQQLTFAQFNMNLLSTVSYNQDLNDIWGWVDESTGTEYALVGVRNGVSIVSLEDPTNAQELFFIPGQNSTWRDLKTWGNYAYVTTDQGGTTDGLLVIDLSDLPNSIDYYNWNPVFSDLGPQELNTCHNIYIDEFGYAYLAGCNLNGGGIIYIDVHTNPWNPSYAGAGPSVYSHDVYVRDNKSFSSEIYGGELAIYDVTDKDNTTLLGSVETPYSFTHNSWLSDDGTVTFTTDELANAPVAAYDVSDPTDIQYLDEYKPLATVGSNVIPHNVHVWNDFLIISYYTDGGRIVDSANPENLIEVGNFDTFLGGGAGFNGAWGAYPFLPSGNVLITDIGNGLYVCGVNYLRACYLEGIVTDANTTDPIFQVNVEIDSDIEINGTTSDVSGDYKTGLATAGTYDVTFSHPNYISQTISVELDNGILTELDVQLQPKEAIQGIVYDEANTTIINSFVQLTNPSSGETLNYTAGANGNIQIFADEGSYTALVGAWGFRTIETTVEITQGVPVEFTLEAGYEDDFTFDFGWSTLGTASTGDFEWVVPQESEFANSTTTLGFDLPTDFSNKCYVTGNGGNGGANDIDDGYVRLGSPIMDLSNYLNATVDFSAFFWVGGGNGGPVNDSLHVFLSDGSTTSKLISIYEPTGTWENFTFNIQDYVSLSNTVQIIFEAADDNPGHIVEAMVDGIYVDGELASNNNNLDQLALNFELGPNPFRESFNYTMKQENNKAYSYEIIDISGKSIQKGILESSGSISINSTVPAGNYLIVIQEDNQLIHSQELIKQ